MTDTMQPAARALTVDLGMLADLVEAINQDTADIESTTVEEAARLLAALRPQIALLRQCEAGIERWIARCFAAEGWRDPHELPGIGMVEVRRSKTRRAWQHDLLKSKWLAAYVKSTGGEVTDPAQVRDALFDVVSVSGWKVTGLKALDIDPDDYCDSEPGTPTVVIA